MRRKHWLKNDKKKIYDESFITALASQENQLTAAEDTVEGMWANKELGQQQYDLLKSGIGDLRALIAEARKKGRNDEELKKGFLRAVLKLSILKRKIDETKDAQ